MTRKKSTDQDIENPEPPEMDDHLSGDPVSSSDRPEDPGPEEPGGDLDTQSIRADQQAAFDEAGVSQDMAALRDEIEATLLQASGRVDIEATGAGAVDGIVGVGIGLGDPDSVAGGLHMPGEPSLTVYTEAPMSQDALIAAVANSAGTRALSSMPIKQVTVGTVDAFSHRNRHRPAPGGVSVGHKDITAGTLGSRAIGLSGPWRNRHLILSNNHVLANSNAGRVGDSIVQPGRADGGQHPRDQVAILSKWVPIRFGGAANIVDCAYGWAWHQRIRGEQYYQRGGRAAYYRTGTRCMSARLGMTVGKSGRTTGLTQGRVTQIGVSVNVNFGGGRVALFRNQMAIRSVNSRPFSAGGDSGSVIWHWARGVRPVGLLFAGGGGTTFANPMCSVLDALDIRLLP